MVRVCSLQRSTRRPLPAASGLSGLRTSRLGTPRPRTPRLGTPRLGAPAPPDAPVPPALLTAVRSCRRPHFRRPHGKGPGERRAAEPEFRPRRRPHVVAGRLPGSPVYPGPCSACGFALPRQPAPCKLEASVVPVFYAGGKAWRSEGDTWSRLGALAPHPRAGEGNSPWPQGRRKAGRWDA